MAKMAMIERSAGVLTGSLALIVVVILITFCANSSAATALPARVPQIWYGANYGWVDHVIPTTPETVIEITINKTWNRSPLRIDFAGGKLTSKNYAGGMPQVTFGIRVDDVTRAESVTFVHFHPTTQYDYPTISCYPTMSTIVGDVSSGAHKISVVAWHTYDPGQPLYDFAFYTTKSVGQQPNTYKAYLIVEEWPTSGPKPAAAE